jgi:hypothetical protein
MTDASTFDPSLLRGLKFVWRLEKRFLFPRIPFCSQLVWNQRRVWTNLCWHNSMNAFSFFTSWHAFRGQRNECRLIPQDRSTSLEAICQLYVPFSVAHSFLRLQLLNHENFTYTSMSLNKEPVKLLAGRLRGWSSSLGRGKIFLFTQSRPILGPTKPPIEWVPRVKRPERESDHFN